MLPCNVIVQQVGSKTEVAASRLPACRLRLDWRDGAEVRRSISSASPCADFPTEKTTKAGAKDHQPSKRCDRKVP
jgi:hypothetical protein